jgi:hypothetical protein
MLGSTTRRACTESTLFLTKCADGSPARTANPLQVHKGRAWNGYSPYNPGNVVKVLDIMRTVHNYILPGKDGHWLRKYLPLRMAYPHTTVSLMFWVDCRRRNSGSVL